MPYKQLFLQPCRNLYKPPLTPLEKSPSSFERKGLVGIIDTASFLIPTIRHENNLCQH